MLARLVFVTEIIAIIIGLYRIFGQKLCVNIGFIAITILSMLAHETITLLGIEQASTTIFGCIFFVFCKIIFKKTVVQTGLGIVLLYVIITLCQVICLIITYILIPDNEAIRTLCVNAEVLLFSMFLLPKFRVDKALTQVKLKNRYTILFLVLIGAIVFVVLLQSKSLNGIRADWFIILAPTIVVLTIIFGKWNSSQRTIEQMEVEKETIANMQHKFENLLTAVRIRQHEFKNHITAILAAHYTYKTYEKLVKAQEEYCMKLQNENRYNNLLFIENNLLAGFLYEKLQVMEAEGISVEYKVAGNLKNTVLPTYYLIEIIGILINNAIEAGDSAEVKEIYIEVCEDETKGYFIIRNKYKYVSYSEIEQWFQIGNSSKGIGRGIGLFHVKSLCEEWNTNVLCENVVIEDKNWIQFTIVLDKCEMDNQR